MLGNGRQTMSGPGTTPYRMEVQCPHCGMPFHALSPADKSKPVAVYPDGGCPVGAWSSGNGQGYSGAGSATRESGKGAGQWRHRPTDWGDETVTTETHQHFVGERLDPVPGTFDTSQMSAGAPGLPRQFGWRGTLLDVAGVVRVWKETGACRNGSSERYVRKHWFEVETTSRQRARIYFERQPRGRCRQARWWLFSIEDENGRSAGSACPAAAPSGS